MLAQHFVGRRPYEPRGLPLDDEAQRYEVAGEIELEELPQRNFSRHLEIALSKVFTLHPGDVICLRDGNSARFVRVGSTGLREE